MASISQLKSAMGPPPRTRVPSRPSAVAKFSQNRDAINVAFLSQPLRAKDTDLSFKRTTRHKHSVRGPNAEWVKALPQGCIAFSVSPYAYSANMTNNEGISLSQRDKLVVISLQQANRIGADGYLAMRQGKIKKDYQFQTPDEFVKKFAYAGIVDNKDVNADKALRGNDYREISFNLLGKSPMEDLLPRVARVGDHVYYVVSMMNTSSVSQSQKQGMVTQVFVRCVRPGETPVANSNPNGQPYPGDRDAVYHRSVRQSTPHVPLFDANGNIVMVEAKPHQRNERMVMQDMYELGHQKMIGVVATGNITMRANTGSFRGNINPFGTPLWDSQTMPTGSAPVDLILTH